MIHSSVSGEETCTLTCMFATAGPDSRRSCFQPSLLIINISVLCNAGRGKEGGDIRGQGSRQQDYRVPVFKVCCVHQLFTATRSAASGGAGRCHQELNKAARPTELNPEMVSNRCSGVTGIFCRSPNTLNPSDEATEADLLQEIWKEI